MESCSAMLSLNAVKLRILIHPIIFYIFVLYPSDDFFFTNKTDSFVESKKIQG